MRSRTVNGLKISIAGVIALAATTALWARPDNQEHGGTPQPFNDEPTTRPGRGPGGPGGAGGDHERTGFGGFGFGRRGPGENAANAAPPTAEEWADIATFMQENSPVRLKLYQQVETDKGPSAPVTLMIRRRIAGRHKDLQSLKERSPDLYEFAIKQVQLEDKALGTLLDLKKDADNAALQQQFKDQMHEFVENSLGERQARLGKLRDLVAKEESNLARDRGDVATLEANQQAKFKKDMQRMLDYPDGEGHGPSTQPSDEK